MRRFSLVSLFLILMYLAACSPEPANSITIITPYANVTPAVPSPSDDSFITEEPSKIPEYRLASDETYEIEPGLEWDMLTMDIPKISREDMKDFNPEKAEDYILAAYVDDDYLVSHDYSIADWNVINGVLYLTISDSISSYNVNNDYMYLKETFELSDEDIRKLPVYSNCYIDEGYMYVNKAAWEDRKKFYSIEDWETSAEYDVNRMEYGPKTISDIRVANDALIMPLVEDSPDLYLLSTQEFIEYLSNEDNSDYCFFTNGVYLNYESGYITAVEEVFYP